MSPPLLYLILPYIPPSPMYRYTMPHINYNININIYNILIYNTQHKWNEKKYFIF